MNCEIDSEKNSPEIETKNPRRRFFWLYFFAGFLLILGCGADYIARFLLLHPTRLEPQWTPPFPDCEEAWIPTANGDVLHGVYFPVKKESGNKGPVGTILYSHGNGDTVAEWGEVGVLLREKLNTSVLVYDYRGYGKSEGTPTASSILEEGRAARKWLADREKIPESEIILMGRSLGGAVAIDLASQDGAKALIVESTFASLPEMGARLAPGIPTSLLLREQLQSVKKIAEYDGPLFLSHGTADTLIPFKQGERIFAASKSKRKIFYPISGGNHNTLPPPEYYVELKKFVDLLCSN